MATMDDLRAAALALPGMVEAPHFHLASFRLAKRIVAQETAPGPGDCTRAVVNVPLGQAEILVEVRPDVFDFATWGSWRGLRIRLAEIEADELAELVQDAWARFAPAKLRASHAPAGSPAVS